MAQPLYPPSPTDVPEDLTRPTSDYRFKTTLLLLALGLFFVLYFVLTAFCGLFVYWVLFSGIQRGVPFLPRLVLAAPGALMFVYLVKSLFRWESPERTYSVEIFEQEHPRLFAFIERLCDETGAPYPGRVFVDFQVNAYASQEISLLHLFIPSPKYLTIGLGLVNSINLTEFKALLAHEFGHFSQKSMKLNGYVYTACRIVEGIVRGQDVFDRAIDASLRWPAPFSWPAWAFWGILWVFRKLMIGFHKAIFFFDSGRRQQMEFNADLVAVSVTGSDAPVHLLYKSAFADHCLQQAVSDMEAARDHHLYTADMFHHQTHSVGFVRQREKKPRLGLPPPLPKDRTRSSEVFEPDDHDAAQMWASHPPNYDREENAKERYIRSDFDERSPWLLFDRVDELREDVTVAFYRFHFKIPRSTIFADPHEIQAFIDEERAERTYNPAYQGLYDGRILMFGDVYKLAQEGKGLPWSTELLRQTHGELYDAEVKHRSQLFYKRLDELQLLRAVSRGWHKPKNDEIDFRGEIYDCRDAKRLFKKVDRELKTDFDWLKDLDKRVFLTYFQMALHLGQEVAEELYRRYAFHMQLQQIWEDLRNAEESLEGVLNFLYNQNNQRIDGAAFQELVKIFREVHTALKDCLRDSEEMILPSLKNLTPGQPLRSFLLEKNLVKAMSRYTTGFTHKWVMKLRAQLLQVKKKCDRIHFKSLGGMLTLQERIAAECLRRWAAPQSGVPAERQAPSWLLDP